MRKNTYSLRMFAVVLGGLVAIACGADTGDAGIGDGGTRPGGKNPFGFADALSSGNGTTTGTTTDNCGLAKFNLDKLPGELMLVLDRSGSMRDPLPNSMQRKWDAVTAAIDQTLMTTQAQVKWGLKLYPMGGGECGAGGPPEVGVMENNYAAISSAIMMNPTMEGQYTPTRVAIQNANTYMSGLTTPNPKFILLATDGQPNCIPGQDRDDRDDDGAVTAISGAAQAGFPVFVMGIAINDRADGVLNRMADAGGRPRNATPRYYPANSQADLVAALSQIAGQVVSCTFTLNKAPPSPSDVAVDIDGMRVPRDNGGTNGWSYGAGMTSINFSGSWCENIKSGKLKDVQIIFGCPGMAIP